MNEHDTSVGEDTNPEEQETKPARVARDHSGFSLRRNKTAKALYVAAGGVAALGAGAMAEQLTQPPSTQPLPAPPRITYVQDLGESTASAPGTILFEDMKNEMQAADEAIRSDPVAAKRYQAELKKASLPKAALQDMQEFRWSGPLSTDAQAAELRASAVDDARSRIADEVRQAPLAVDLSVEAASVFVAGLLLDILRETRSRFVGKIVDAIFKGRLGGQQPDAATQAIPANAAASVSATEAAIQDLANELAGYLRALHAESEYAMARRNLAEAFDGAQQALAEQRLERYPNAERIAAITRTQAANLVTRAEKYGV